MTIEFKMVPVEPTAEMKAAARNTPLAIVFLDSLQAREDLKNCAVFRAMLAAAPASPQPIYDEAKERELFETFQVEEGGNIDFENGYYDNVFVQSAWDGWKACAQSRAKPVEVGHE